MDQGLKPEKKQHPKEKANILKTLSFSYTIPLFRKGFKKDLEEDDLYEVIKTCRSKNLGDKLELQYELDKKHHKSPSLVRALWGVFGKTYIWLGIAQLIMRTVMVLLVPQALGKLVSYFSPGQTELSRQDAYYYAAIVIGFNIIHLIYQHNYLMFLHEFGIRVRTAICSFIYRKSLRMSDAALAEVSMGRIVTLITKDIFAVELMVIFVNEIWIGLFLTGLICYLIYQKIGVAAFVGVGFFLFILPVQALIGKMSSKLRLKASKKTDERIQLTQEILTTIKTIKMYAWEKFFRRKIHESRRKEVNAMFVLFYLKIVIVIIGNLSAKVAFYLLIMTYVWLGNFITAEIVYFVMSCFSKLQHFLSIMIPLGISFGAEFHATLVRIRSILEAEEIPTSRAQIELVTKEPSISFRNVTVKIKKQEILKNIQLNIRRGLNVIVGHIGSGKTIFLKTILENYKIEGILHVTGKISYASQEAWLFPATLKHNILFGEPLDVERYNKVLEMCALHQDLKSFPLGDQSIVGDNGTNLSKGQQARVNLARAIYKKADIYLLDDCLAALDGHVADHIFQTCILNYLQDKLCILVSNNSQHAKVADNVINLNQGVAKFDDTKQITESKNKELTEIIPLLTEETNTADSCQKLYVEEKKKGKVDFDIYKKYIQFGGGYFVFSLIAVIYIGVQSVVSYTDKLVSKWVTLEQNLSSYKMNNLVDSPEFTETEANRTRILNLYTIMIVSATLLSLLKSLGFFSFNRKASINLHKAMASKIIRAKMIFFDSCFIGNVLNRFSKDLGTVDEHLPFTMNECLSLILVMVGVLFLVATVNAWFLVPAGVFMAIAYVTRFGYLRTARSLQRLDASTRSPLMGHLNASLEGLTTIRAFKAEELIKNEFDRHQDLYTSVNYSIQTSMRALGFVLDGMCSIFITIVILTFLLGPSDTSVGNVGLAISQSFHLTGLLQYGIRRWADFESQMTSVERAVQYTEVEQEPKGGSTLEKWPEKGKIVFDSVSMKYKNNRQVLKNLTFTVQPTQKIGIVGRTGAGKSSIIASLFRLYDSEGVIKIDEAPIKDLSLKFLRSQIAIIPQDPILISGTVRQNIDPLKKYQDEEIWKVIKITNLGTIIDNLSTKIDSTNFSAGQKQLLCLARALIRKNKIVILDEATANLDNDTDALMRQVISDNFSACTVITIAHRLLSVLSSDVVMVVDNGQIVEQDAPDKLMEDKNSRFFNMMKST